MRAHDRARVRRRLREGGVGKTTTAVNAAAAMAEAGRSVVLVDYDLGMANLGTVLEVEPADATLHDVLAGTPRRWTLSGRRRVAST